MGKQVLLRITTISYGAAVIIISAIIHYLTIPGIENCNTMSGIVSSYTSNDYLAGCHLLSNMQFGALVTEVIGAAIAIFGVLQKSKTKQSFFRS